MKNLIILLFALLFFTACDKNRVFETNTDIPDSLWDAGHKVSFDVPINDTVSPHNVYVNVRNTGAYPFRNLFVFLDTKFPDGVVKRDTLELILADNSGKWLGDGAGDIWDNRILFKKGVRFPISGNYTFTFEQAMRMPKLPFIMDVGLRIEKQ